MKRFNLNDLRPVPMAAVKAAMATRARKGAVEEIHPSELRPTVRGPVRRVTMAASIKKEVVRG